MDARAVDSRDEFLLLQWRNDEQTREQSFNSDFVDAGTHRRWFAGLLDDPSRVALIGEADGVPVGVVRVDPQRSDGRISVTLAPEARGRGLAVPLIELGVEAWLARGGGRIVAEIRETNEPSLRSFASAGFATTSSDGGVVLMERLP